MGWKLWAGQRVFAIEVVEDKGRLSISLIREMADLLHRKLDFLSLSVCEICVYPTLSSHTYHVTIRRFSLLSLTPSGLFLDLDVLSWALYTFLITMKSLFFLFCRRYIRPPSPHPIPSLSIFLSSFFPLSSFYQP